MEHKIKTGDTVYIKWKGAPPELATVLHMPQGESDLIQIQYYGGLVQAFSPARIDYTLEKQVKG